MNLSNIITIDKNILGGIPVFTGTRVPIQNLFDYLEAGDNINDFLEDFDYIPKIHVLNVLQSTQKMFLETKLYENLA